MNHPLKSLCMQCLLSKFRGEDGREGEAPWKKRAMQSGKLHTVSGSFPHETPPDKHKVLLRLKEPERDHGDPRPGIKISACS